MRASEPQRRGGRGSFLHQQSDIGYWTAQGSTQTNAFHKKLKSRILLKFMPNNKTPPTPELKGKEKTTKHYDNRINKLKSNIKLKCL